jgi:hypothetical protein
MLEDKNNSTSSQDQNAPKRLDPNPLFDDTPRWFNGASLPGGMRRNDLGLDQGPPPSPLDSSSEKSESPSEKFNLLSWVKGLFS